jgi:putative transposase
LCRAHEISAATFYAWKSKYSGMDVSQTQRLKAMQDENRRLKLLVADLSLHGKALKAVIRKQLLELPPHGIKNIPREPLFAGPRGEVQEARSKRWRRRGGGGEMA